MNKSVILASTSRWRRSLLEDAGISCEALDPCVDESTIVGKDPVDTSRLRAEAKANSIARQYPEALVIGADQVIELDGLTVGKPMDDQDWRARLESLRGRTHDLTTAVAIAEGQAIEVFHLTTQIRFRADLTDEEISAYIAHGEARGCAGGYMVERRGAWMVESVSGDWLNVVGLPILPLIGRLRARGWRLTPPEGL